MSVNALSPRFSDEMGYREWRRSWRIVYRELTNRIRKRKIDLKAEQRAMGGADLQRELFLMSRDATKMMKLLSDAKFRMDRILAMREQIVQQNAQFPLVIDTRLVDVHFNRISNEFPEMPMWTVKTQGRSYYVRHIDAQMGFSTRELAEGSTRGMLRFRNVTLTLDQEGVATITPKVSLAA